MFSNFANNSSILENQEKQYRKSRYLQYLRAINQQNEKTSKWKTIREKRQEILRMEPGKNMLDLNKSDRINLARNPNYTQFRKFRDVVSAAMSVKRWMLSMESDRQESEMERCRSDSGASFQPINTPPDSRDPLMDQSFCISMTSSRYYYWTCWVSLGILYNMLAMVIFIFRDVYLNYFWCWITINSIFDLVFLCDIFIQSRLSPHFCATVCTVFKNHSHFLAYLLDGIEVKNVRKLWKNYIKSGHIYPDILCVLPFDIFLIFKPSLSIIRIIRLVKIYRLSDFISLTLKRTSSPHATKIIFLTTCCYIIFHWNSSIYFLFSLFEGLSVDDMNAFGFSYYKVFDPIFPTCQVNYENCWFPENYENVLDIDEERAKYVEQLYRYWIGKQYKLEMGNFSREYSMTMYWSALTITKCGQQPWPSTSPQNLLEVVDTLIGVLVFATIIGSVGNVVTQMNQSVYDFREMMDGIKFYMKYRAVHLDIQERVLNCFMYLNTHNQLYDEKETLEVLPARFQSNIAANLHLETLKRVQLFSNCDNRFLHEVVLLVKQQVYSPNDYLCRKNEKAKEMFIVKKGTLGVIDDDTGVQLEQLYEGSTFGELSIIHVKGNLLGDRRSVSLRSVGYSDIYVLHQDHVTRLLQEYPDDRDVLLRNAQNMLNSRGLLLPDFDDLEDEENEELNRHISIDQKLEEIRENVENLDKSLTKMIQSFTNSSANQKQRLRALEHMIIDNHHQIRQDCIKGIL